MNKRLTELRPLILESLEREKRELLGKREVELAKVETRIMHIKRGNYKLDSAMNKPNIRKTFKTLKLALVIIEKDDKYLAAWGDK